MADAPGSQYVQGPPGPDQLPKGEATQLNNAAPPAAEAPPTPPVSSAAPAAPQGEPQPVQPPVKFVPQSDAQKYLVSPGKNPNRKAVPLQGLRVEDFGDWVPALAAAAARPDATPQAKALFNAVMLGPLP